MTIKKCKFCGVKLTRKNKYKSKNGHSIGKQCYECHIMRKKEKRTLLTRVFAVSVKRGSYSPFKFTFSTEQERRSFRTLRSIQIRWGRAHTDSSSYVGRTVDEFIQYMDQDTQTYRQYYIDAKCNQLRDGQRCGSRIEYDKHGYKCCTKCGVFHSASDFNILEFINRETNKNNEELNAREDQIPTYNYDGYDDKDTSDVHSTFDSFYSEAYNNTLK